MELFRYGCTALAGTNKVGDLKPDANGCYPMVIGGYNCNNGSGAFYPWTNDVRQLYADSSSLQRKVKNRNLTGESGHPRRTPGMTDKQWLERVIDVYETNESHAIWEIWADDGLFKGADGQPIVAIMGLIRPQGDKGDSLRDILSTPGANVNFSIRCLSFDQRIRGRLEKLVRSIITYDRVGEPGIPFASKFMAPSLESANPAESMIVSRDMLDELVYRKNNNLVGMETSNNAKSIILDISSRRPRPNEIAFSLGGSSRWGK